MKKSKLLSLLALATLAPLTLAGCDNAKWKIGILLPVEHNALQSCANGFIEGLKSAGLEEGKDFSIEIKNAAGKDADLQNFAKQLVTSKCMTFGLGTGASQALKSASIDKGSLNPVLFSAVTDPVDAGLVESLENGKGFVTGSSDAQPIAEQIALVKECIPDADKIGIIYTQSETNSKVQADQAEEAAKLVGMSVVRQTVTGPGDINTVALALASEEGIDAIYVPTDNNIAANMNAVKEAANSKHVLVVAGEEGMLTTGGHITLSIDYKELGKRTGEVAAQILKGEKNVYEVPVMTMSKEDCKFVYSSANLAASGINLPQSVLDKSEDISK